MKMSFCASFYSYYCRDLESSLSCYDYDSCEISNHEKSGALYSVFYSMMMIVSCFAFGHVIFREIHFETMILWLLGFFQESYSWAMRRL